MTISDKLRINNRCKHKKFLEGILMNFNEKLISNEKWDINKVIIFHEKLTTTGCSMFCLLEFTQ